MGAPVPTGTLRPSQAPRWGECPGSHALEALYPDLEDSPEAREGTAAHHYVMEALLKRVVTVGAVAPNGHPVDAKMIEYGQEYIHVVSQRWGVVYSSDPRAIFRVETKIFAHQLIHTANEGTPDTFMASIALKRVDVFDYKYGHKFVDPFRNWQLINYLAGIFEGLQVSREEVADWTITFWVGQPRSYNPDGTMKTWETTGANAWRLIEALRVAAINARMPDAPTRTGSWCADCNGRHACEAFARVSARACDMAGESTPFELPAGAIGLELQRIATARKRLEARESGLTEQALALIRTGKRVAGWEMGSVQSKEIWEAPLKEVFALGDLMGVELRVEAGVTPAKARQLGIDASVISAYARRPPGAAKLVPSNPDAAEKAFGAPPPP